MYFMLKSQLYITEALDLFETVICYTINKLIEEFKKKTNIITYIIPYVETVIYLLISYNQ